MYVRTNKKSFTRETYLNVPFTITPSSFWFSVCSEIKLELVRLRASLFPHLSAVSGEAISLSAEVQRKEHLTNTTAKVGWLWHDTVAQQAKLRSGGLVYQWRLAGCGKAALIAVCTSVHHCFHFQDWGVTLRLSFGEEEGVRGRGYERLGRTAAKLLEIINWIALKLDPQG